MARVYNEPELEDWYARQGAKYDGGPLPEYWQNKLMHTTARFSRLKQSCIVLVGME